MRIFGYILIGLLAASLLAVAIRPAPAPKGITPLIWVSDDNPARRPQIKLFNNLNPDLRLQLDPDNGGMEKIIVQSLAGVGPDVFDSSGPQSLAAYVQAGIAWDITDELAAAGIDVRNDVWQAIHNSFIYEGRVYGLPNSAVDALWFNKTIFDKLNVPYPARRPWTWEEFIPIARKLTVREPNGRIRHYGFCYDPWSWNFFLVQWGGRVYSPDGTRCTLDAPEAMAAIQFMHDLIYKHRIVPTPAEMAAMPQEGGFGTGSSKMFAAGRAATALGGRWWLPNLRRYEHQRLGAVEAPHGPRRRFSGYGRSTLINRNSPHRQAALRFMLFLTSPEYNRLLNQQADSLPPMIRYCTDEDLVNPVYPHEDYHPVFRDALLLGEPEEVSPFVNAYTAGQIINGQLDMILGNHKSVAEGLGEAVRAIHAERDKQLRRDPALRQRYEKLTGGRAP